MSVTVVIPHIPIRDTMLPRALKSVFSQTQPADVVTVITDVRHEGSAATRNRALAGVTTEWIAFLDDDDEWYPQHLKSLLAAARSTGADVIYPGCDVQRDGQLIPRQEEWGRYGQSFDADLLRRRSYIPVTSLVRTELVRKTRGFEPPPESQYDDWGFYLQLLDVGARFYHLPRVTWRWHHGDHNTSGQGDRW